MHLSLDHRQQINELPTRKQALLLAGAFLIELAILSIWL